MDLEQIDVHSDTCLLREEVNVHICGPEYGILSLSLSYTHTAHTGGWWWGRREREREREGTVLLLLQPYSEDFKKTMFFSVLTQSKESDFRLSAEEFKT